MQDLLTKGIDEKGNIRSEKTHKFKDSPLGKIPEEWEVVRLGEVGEIIYGERLNEYEYVEDGSSIVYGTTGIIARTERYIDVGETIILPRKGSINNKFYVEKDQKFFVIDTAFYVKFTKAEVNVKYIYYFLHQVNFELLNEATGVPSLNRENLKNILIPLPPLSEQQRIAEILLQIDQTIEKEEKYKQKLERLKKGLMEDLLTGKVRVNKLVEGENHGMA
jgi:type I restriction enzyme S subunit